MWKVSAEPFPFDMITSAYDAASLIYSKKHKDLTEVDKIWLDEAVSMVPIGLPIIDIGCGTGLITGYLRHKVRTLIGLDHSYSMLQASCKSLSLECLWVQGNLRQLPFMSGCCGMYVAFYSLIHLSDAELKTSLYEAARVLCPNGIAIIAVHEYLLNEPCPSSHENWIITDDFMETGFPLGLRLIQWEHLEKLIEESHLTPIRVYRRLGSEERDELPTSRLIVIASKRLN